jgi:hypothetical protein
MASIMRIVRLNMFGSEHDDDQKRAQEDVSFRRSALGTYGALGEETRTAHLQQDDASSSSSSSVNDQETLRVSFSNLSSYQADIDSLSFDVFKHKPLDGNDSACELTDEETASLVSDEESFTVRSHFLVRDLDDSLSESVH